MSLRIPKFSLNLLKVKEAQQRELEAQGLDL